MMRRDGPSRSKPSKNNNNNHHRPRQSHHGRPASRRGYQQPVRFFQDNELHWYTHQNVDDAANAAYLEQILDDILTDHHFLHRIKVIQNLGNLLERIKMMMKYNSRYQFISRESAMKIIGDMTRAGWFHRNLSPPAVRKPKPPPVAAAMRQPKLRDFLSRSRQTVPPTLSQPYSVAEPKVKREKSGPKVKHDSLPMPDHYGRLGEDSAENVSRSKSRRVGAIGSVYAPRKKTPPCQVRIPRDLPGDGKVQTKTPTNSKNYKETKTSRLRSAYLRKDSTTNLHTQFAAKFPISYDSPRADTPEIGGPEVFPPLNLPISGHQAVVTNQQNNNAESRPETCDTTDHCMMTEHLSISDISVSCDRSVSDIRIKSDSTANSEQWYFEHHVSPLDILAMDHDAQFITSGNNYRTNLPSQESSPYGGHRSDFTASNNNDYYNQRGESPKEKTWFEYDCYSRSSSAEDEYSTAESEDTQQLLEEFLKFRIHCESDRTKLEDSLPFQSNSSPSQQSSRTNSVPSKASGSPSLSKGIGDLKDTVSSHRAASTRGSQGDVNRHQVKAQSYPSSPTLSSGNLLNYNMDAIQRPKTSPIKQCSNFNREENVKVLLGLVGFPDIVKQKCLAKKSSTMVQAILTQDKPDNKPREQVIVSPTHSDESLFSCSDDTFTPIPGFLTKEPFTITPSPRDSGHSLHAGTYMNLLPAGGSKLDMPVFSEERTLNTNDCNNNNNNDCNSRKSFREEESTVHVKETLQMAADQLVEDMMNTLVSEFAGLIFPT